MPTTSHPSLFGFEGRYPWKVNIVTTVFWVGEKPTPNNPVPNTRSAWDVNWVVNYGGFDDPDPGTRRNYIPANFTPRQNPFYFALPYNDVTSGDDEARGAAVIPWFKEVVPEIWAERLPEPLDRDPEPQRADLLRAMVGLRAVPDGSLAICLRQRDSAVEYQPRRGPGCLARGAGFSRIERHGRDLVAVRRFPRCAAGAVVVLRGEQ